MKKLLITLGLTLLGFAATVPLRGADAAPATNAPPPVPTLEQRLSSLEAYVNNGDPTPR